VFSITGGCLCGIIRYEITQPPQFIYTCHCTDCQRITSSAFSMALVVEGTAFRLTGAELRPLQRKAANGKPNIRWVCTECGIWICGGPKPGSATAGAIQTVRAGTLDDTSWVTPSVHFWTRSAQPWLTFNDADRCFETQPEDLRRFFSSGGHNP
jgi:hypothetical protein